MIRKTMRKQPFYFPLFIAIMACIVVCQVFFSVLAWLSFENYYISLSLEPYKIIGRSLSNDIRHNLSMGKTFTRFQTFPSIAESSINNTKEIVAVILYMQDGSIAQYYSPDGHPHSQLEKLPFISPFNETLPSSYASDKYVHILTPVTDSSIFRSLGIEYDQNDTSGLVDVVVNKSVYEQQVEKMFFQFVTIVLITSVVIFITICSLLLVIPLRLRGGPLRSRLIIALVIIPLIAGQSVLSFLFYSSSNDISSHQITSVISQNTTLLAARIERITELGLAADDISDMDSVLGEMLALAPSVDTFALFNTSGGMAACSGVRCDQSAFDFSLPIRGPEGKIAGYARSSINIDIIKSRLNSNIMDTMTIFLISLLLMNELAILAFSFFKRRKEKSQKKLSPGMLRVIAFFCILGMDFSISFIPLCMKELLLRSSASASIIMLGLPVSLEMAFAGLAVLVGARWSIKQSSVHPFAAGLALAACGNLFSAVASTPETYILARCLTGFGYGFLIIALQSMIVKISPPSMSGANIAILFAGVYAGNVCGSSLGGMLAERMGFAPVFLLGAIVLGIMLAISLVFFRRLKAETTEESVCSGAIALPSNESSDQSAPRAQDAPAFSFRSIWEFISNKDIGSLMAFIVFPGSLASVGMLNFLIPIKLDMDGVSQSDIGRVFMVFSLVFIVIAPIVAGVTAKLRSSIPAILLGGFLGGMSLFFFAIPQGTLHALPSAFLAVLCSSLALALGMSPQITFMLNNKTAEKIGKEQAMSIYNTVERVGQVSGPMVFGSALMVAGSSLFPLGAGAAIVVCALIFPLIARNKSHGKSNT